MDFRKEIYSFDDIPIKKKYILKRIQEIYPDRLDEAKKILDSISIQLRTQDEKGASNHLKKMIYVSSNEIDRYEIKDRKDFIKYLEDPKSVILHEATHIFQNLFEAFPHRTYVFKDKEDGDYEIDYKKYVTDPGEVQARVEQVLELLAWGFERSEVVNFLFSRRHDDLNVWKKLVDKVIDMKKKATSKLPGIDDDNISQENEQGRRNRGEIFNLKDRGNNYEKDYMT